MMIDIEKWLTVKFYTNNETWNEVALAFCLCC